jgi:hypothetical protein
MGVRAGRGRRSRPGLVVAFAAAAALLGGAASVPATASAAPAAAVLRASGPTGARGAAGASGEATSVRAGAEGDVTAAEAAALARRAATDDGALAELRAVERVDGRAVDLAAATRGIGGATDRAARLDALADELAGGGGGGSTDPDRARADARDVLRGDDYQDRTPPRPFRGVLRWLGERLAPVGRALDTVFGPLWRAAGRIPGGRALVLLALAGLAVAAIARLAGHRSRARVVGAGAAGGLVDLAADPARLEAEAEAAAAAGDHALAVRRRYEAGILRLARAGRLDLRPETTPAAVAAAVGGEPIGALTRTFEEVVYGGRAATAAEDHESRQGWAQLLAVGARR